MTLPLSHACTTMIRVLPHSSAAKHLQKSPPPLVTGCRQLCRPGWSNSRNTVDCDTCLCSVGDDPETVTLPLRKEARQRVMSGDIDGAATLLAQQCPQLLSSGSSAAEEVQFHLACQTYIELLRYGAVLSL